VRILLAGATGLVGSRLLPMLLAAGHQVTAVGRRPSGVSHPTLAEIRTDFTDLPALPSGDVAISALGTTMAAAGSREAFSAVDKTAVSAFACAARNAGCRQFVLMTAVGASASATVFYSCIKGEVENIVKEIGFERLDLIRPGLILGPRSDRRPAEAVFQRLAPVLNPLLPGSLSRYGAIPAETIAAAITRLAGAREGGVHIHENQALRRLASGG
jgi:uncharacterized protein YbjT (DUF2867 family)